MLKDITIGQHFPGKSPVHNLDARLKIIFTVVYVVVLFMSTNIPGLVMSGAIVLVMYKIAQIPLKMLQKSLKPMMPLIFFTVVLNLFFAPRPIPLFFRQLSRRLRHATPEACLHARNQARRSYFRCR